MGKRANKHGDFTGRPKLLTQEIRHKRTDNTGRTDERNLKAT